MPGQMLGTTPPPISGEIIYSFEERLVGAIINEGGVARNLYQKTINCGALPNATTKLVSHNIQNVDRVYCTYGCAFASADASWTYGLPYATNTVTSCIGVLASATSVQLSCGTNRSGLNVSLVTILYTCTDR